MPDNGIVPLRLRPRDPVLFRDARPFAAEPGARAFTLPWPLPSTVAGAIRSHLIASEPGFTGWDGAASQRALAIPVAGPLLQRTDATGAWQTYLPAPLDALIYDDRNYVERIMTLRPDETLAHGAGTDGGGMAPLRVTAEVKPKTSAAFWSLDDIARWLLTAEPNELPRETLPRLPTDARTHVAIEPGTLTHRGGALFTTEALVFADDPATALLCRADHAGARRGFTPLGGERRLATLEPLPPAEWPAPRIPSEEAIARATGLRLLLVTPAAFSAGWRPTWTEPGTPPTLTALAGLDLVAAAVGRRVPVSGWDLQTRGARATRYLAPAGSVYFFKPQRGHVLPRQLFSDLWLTPVSDAASDRRDGYGLAIAGIW